MVRLDIGDEQEERFLTAAGPQVLQHPVGLGIHPVSARWKIALPSVAVEHVAIVTVGGELQHVAGQPEVFVAAAPLHGHRLGIGRGQVPLADVADLVARFAEPVGDGLLARRQGDAIAETAGLRGVLPGLERERVGPHTGWQVKAYTNRTPSAAMRSR